jgi:hypothetical protein
MRTASVALAALLLAAGGGAAMARDLADLRWEKRVLALFDAEPSDALERQSAALLADEAALAERDMVVFAVVGDEVRPVYGAPPSDTAASLRERLAAGGGFQAVLIGKDGGVKRRSAEPISLRELEAVIDAMPMRRAGG